jgi:CRP-like cAMP-binding protein
MAVPSGVVKISVVSQDGKEIALNLLGAGEIFGEIALLVAIKLLEVPEHLSGRLRCTSDQVEDLSFGELSVRMAKVLLRFAELQGTISTPRPRVTVTQKEANTRALRTKKGRRCMRKPRRYAATYLTLKD